VKVSKKHLSLKSEMMTSTEAILVDHLGSKLRDDHGKITTKAFSFEQLLI